MVLETLLECDWDKHRSGLLVRDVLIVGTIFCLIKSCRPLTVVRLRGPQRVNLTGKSVYIVVLLWISRCIRETVGVSKYFYVCIQFPFGFGFLFSRAIGFLLGKDVSTESADMLWVTY